MRDAEGRAISHPAAMVYENLAARVGMAEMGRDDYYDNDESVADRMEQMRKPTHQRRLMQRLKQGKPATFFDAKMATRNDEADKKRLNTYRQDARDETQHEMQFGEHSNDKGEVPYKNYGVQQSTGTDVQMIPKKDFPFQYDE